MADKDFFGVADNRIGLDSSGGFEPQYIAPGLGGMSGKTELKPGESTSIEGYTFSVDKGDAVRVKSSGGWFTFDGSLTTQDWKQGCRATGGLTPATCASVTRGQQGMIACSSPAKTVHTAKRTWRPLPSTVRH